MGIRVRYSKSISLRTAAILLVISAVYLLAKGFYRVGEWETFDSNPTRYTTEYPDGYRIEYPANWNDEVFKGYHNSADIRAYFHQPLSTNRRSLRIYWHSLGDMNNQDILDWADEAMSISSIPKNTPIVTQTIGVENYEAIKKEYMHIKKHNDYQVSYIVVEDNEIFLLAFHAEEFDEQTKAIFDRMLASFDIYR